MKQKLIIVIMMTLLFTGCSNKKSLYQIGANELENGNYEKAIEYYADYQKIYGDSVPLHDAYSKYVDFLCDENDYINALYYCGLSKKMDNELSDDITDLVDTIYECGLHYLEQDEDLLAFQYLSYIKDERDIDDNIIPESPLEGI